MTAPMKVLNSAGSPTGIASVAAASGSRSCSHTEWGMYAREDAEHFCPWYSNDPRSKPDEQGVGGRRRVGEHEVLAAGLADQAGIGPVVAEIGGDGVPEMLEGVGRAGEMDAGKRRVS